MSKTNTQALSNICIYPCFDFDWPLRDNTDIMVVEGNHSQFFDSEAFYVLLIVRYSLIASTGLSSLTIAVLTSLPRRWKFRGLRPHSDHDALRYPSSFNGSKMPGEIVNSDGLIGSCSWSFPVTSSSFTFIPS